MPLPAVPLSSDPRRMIRRLVSRALPALASALLALVVLAPVRAQPCLPIEQRLGEQWRWRAVSEPNHDPTFLAVRPWADGGLVAVDANGLVRFDGYEWERRPGWSQVNWSQIRDVVEERDSVVVVASNTIAWVDADGKKHVLTTIPNPSQMSDACRLPDGTLVAGVKRSVRALTRGGAESLFASP